MLAKIILYKIFFFITPSPFGGLFFRITKRKFENDKTSKYGNIWWYGYLYYYACHYNLQKFKANHHDKRVIRKLMPDFDWFMFYNTVFQWNAISHILYLMSKGYTPIINDTWHVWSDFFEQPVESLNRYEKVTELIESDENSPLITPQMIPYIKNVRKTWNKLINDFCQLKPNEKEYIETECKQVLGQGNRILAVVCRGTDYKTANMAKQPEVKDIISKTKIWMKKYNYDKVYLATEDEEIYKQFEKELPGKILVNKRTYYDKAMKDQNVKWIGEVSFNRENDNYYKGLEYLSSIIIVSRCKALLAGYCGASNTALLYNGEKYERFKIM